MSKERKFNGGKNGGKRNKKSLKGQKTLTNMGKVSKEVSDYMKELSRKGWLAKKKKLKTPEAIHTFFSRMRKGEKIGKLT